MVKEHLFKLINSKPIDKCFVKEVYNFSPVIDMLKLANKDTLVVFDIDDVLIMPNPHDDCRQPYRAWLLESIINRLTPEKIEALCSSILAAT